MPKCPWKFIKYLRKNARNIFRSHLLQFHCYQLFMCQWNYCPLWVTIGNSWECVSRQVFPEHFGWEKWAEFSSNKQPSGLKAVDNVGTAQPAVRENAEQQKTTASTKNKTTNMVKSSTMEGVRWTGWGQRAENGFSSLRPAASFQQWGRS